MKNDDIKILVADDNEDNRWLAVHGLVSRLDYNNVIEKTDGADTFEYISHHPKAVDIILLDRMMPQMSGVELYNKMQNIPAFKDIIIIFQTGRSSQEEINEILEIGAEYMLRKPYDPEDMAAFVEQASSRVRRLRYFKENFKVQNKQKIKSSYVISDFNEAKELALDISNNLQKSPYIAEAIYGLLENAIEHGNLEINEQKEMLLKDLAYCDEISRRLKSPEHRNKFVTVKYEKDFDLDKITIQDFGEGFNPEDFFSINSDILLRSHGRGILYAKSKFKKIEYYSNGNIVSFWF